MKSLIIYKSIHNKNTQKIAKKMAETLNAKLQQPEEVDLKDIEKYDLIGFGSGIYFAKHHRTILDLAKKLKNLKNKKVFIFSTSGIKIKSYHKKLKQILKEKKTKVIGEFFCKGFDNNSFLKLIGGINKGRPDKKDLEKAQKFSQKMKKFK
ncbi:MAG: flavodoxin [Candidatus Moranbacteria bacterium]|nr:flavodoxin [Candidatus Moranbacteria bacterium]